MKNNLPELKNRRKNLRNHSTSAEAVLWRSLKAKQICNLKFRRQHSIDNFILDFYCPQLKLGIELDGQYHVYNEAYDRIRDKVLEQYGITILRYENCMVFEHPDVIIDDIKSHYQKTKKHL